MKFKAYAFHRLSRKLCFASLWFSKVTSREFLVYDGKGTKRNTTLA